MATKELLWIHINTLIQKAIFYQKTGIKEFWYVSKMRPRFGMVNLISGHSSKAKNQRSALHYFLTLYLNVNWIHHIKY